MTRPAGWNHTEETKKKISKARAETAARNRDALPWPKDKLCRGECKQVKPIREFGIKKRKLVDGTYSLHPDSKCRKCKAKMVAEWRERQGSKKMAERNKAAYENRRRKMREEESPSRRRLPKEPFLAYVAEKRALKEHEFHRVSNRSNGGTGGASERKGGAFSYQFDRHRFADYLGITETQLASLERISRPTSETMTVDIRLVDHVLNHVGDEHRFHDLYPDL